MDGCPCSHWRRPGERSVPLFRIFFKLRSSNGVFRCCFASLFARARPNIVFVFISGGKDKQAHFARNFFSLIVGLLFFRLINSSILFDLMIVKLDRRVQAYIDTHRGAGQWPDCQLRRLCLLILQAYSQSQVDSSTARLWHGLLLIYNKSTHIKQTIRYIKIFKFQTFDNNVYVQLTVVQPYATCRRTHYESIQR